MAFTEDHQIEISMSYICCKPRLRNLDDLAKDLVENITSELPHLRFFFTTLRSYREYYTTRSHIRLGYLIVRKKIGPEEARVAYFHPDHQFYGVKLNALRCLRLETRLKLLENCEDEALDVLEESFIADYMD